MVNQGFQKKSTIDRSKNRIEMVNQGFQKNNKSIKSTIDHSKNRTEMVNPVFSNKKSIN